MVEEDAGADVQREVANCCVGRVGRREIKTAHVLARQMDAAPVDDHLDAVGRQRSCRCRQRKVCRDKGRVWIAEDNGFVARGIGEDRERRRWRADAIFEGHIEIGRVEAEAGRPSGRQLKPGGPSARTLGREIGIGAGDDEHAGGAIVGQGILRSGRGEIRDAGAAKQLIEERPLE